MKVLYIVHSFPPLEFSGTPLIAQQYALEAVRRGNTVAVAFPGDEVDAQKLSDHQSHQLEFIPLPRSNSSHWALDEFQSFPQQGLPVPDPLRSFAPDIIHIIDWVFFSNRVLVWLRELRVPVIRHIWNFEDICPRISPCFYYADKRACEAPLTSERCGECLSRTLSVSLPPKNNLVNLINELTRFRDKKMALFARDVSAKWENFSSYMAFYDILIFPCDSFRTYFESHRDLGKKKRLTLEHGVIREAPKRFGNRENSGPITFIYIGGGELLRKGWPQIERVFLNLFKAYPSRLRLVAYGIPELARASSPLAKIQAVQMHGIFKFDQLAEILQFADVGLVPSAFETFNRVAREMLSHGLPVIGSRAFGIPEVVKHEYNGLLLDSPTESDLYDAIQIVLTDPLVLPILRRGAESTFIKTIAEEFDELEAVYVHAIDEVVEN